MTTAPAGRPKLLFLSPVFPDVKGNGLAMRGGMFLEALSAVCDVYLLVMPLYPGGSESSIELIERCCTDWTLVQPMPVRPNLRSRLLEAFDSRPSMLRFSRSQAHRTKGAFEGIRFDILHVFRLSMWPIAEAILKRPGPRPEVHLDLDDIESDSMHATAAIRRLNGGEAGAQVEDREATRYAIVERGAIIAVERTYVCSEADRTLLRQLYAPKAVAVVPNSIAMPEVLTPNAPSKPFRFLFVGTFGYYPNEDAMNYFVREVMPRLRERTQQPFQLDIVGAGESSVIRSLAAESDVNVVGEVEDIAASYEAAEAVVVPIRAGGGTRIKALEAFAHRRPVVSTSVGVHGIDVVPGRDVLIADTPDVFTDACLRLMQEPELRASLVENAYRLVTERYSREVVAETIRALFAPPH